MDSVGSWSLRKDDTLGNIREGGVFCEPTGEREAVIYIPYMERSPKNMQHPTTSSRLPVQL